MMEIYKNQLRMRNLIIILIILTSFNSCKSQVRIECQLMDLKWKNLAIEGMTKEYSFYIKTRLSEPINNYAADIYYKVLDLNRYPFGIGIENLQTSLKTNGIKFDSIICITNQVIGFNPEELTGNSFYIYLNNKLTHNFLHDPDSNEIILNEISSNELEQNIARKHLKKDGKDQSLLVFTRFDKNWNFEVYKYIINCENVW